VHFLFGFMMLYMNQKKNDNEEQSMILYEEFSKEFKQPKDIIEGVKSYIMATKTHKSDMQDTDLDYFLDFDIAVLGKVLEAYNEYADNIRKEYIHYPDKEYRSGRIAVLKKLMEGGLFRTQDFKEMFENQAKNNMAQEINKLQSSNNNNAL